MKKNLLNLALISLMSLTMASCGNKDKSDDIVKPSTQNSTNEDVLSSDVDTQSEEESTYSGNYPDTAQPDLINSIPQEVLDANVEIDFLVYIEGQDSAKPDIGNYCWDKSNPNYDKYRYHAEDVTSIEMARWFGAAQAFKQLAPNVKINLKYCSIGDYPTRIEDYQATYGHLPELMWGTEHVIEMLQKGYCTDFNEIDNVANSMYYDAYNEYFMTRFNIGGFQAGIPISAEPWGVFANLDILTDPTNPIIISAVEDGVCTDEYKEWVDNFTWESLVDAVKKTTNSQHAGLSKVVEYFTSYSVPSINDQFIANGTVDLSSEEVRSTIQKLLQYENELSQYCVYEYNEINGASGNNRGKADYPEAANWNGLRDFTENQYCTFYAEAPWALPTIGNHVKSRREEGATNLVNRVDFLPYPKLDEDSDAYTGIAVEGLVVGNQCPIEDGEEVCFEKDSKLKEEVAAYFAMFAALDPRAIAARREVHYDVNGVSYVGDLGLPLIKRDVKFDWQYDDEILALYPDPAADYDDNWSYQLAIYLELYNLYLTNDETPDVEDFTNVMYGLYKMLDSIYMIEGNKVTCLNYWNEPVAIEVGGEIKNIFEKWQNRFTYYREQNDADGTYSGSLGTSSYVQAVMAALSDAEESINKNSAAAWQYVADCVANYYYDDEGDTLYPDITDKSYRNNYEGSKLS